MLVHFGLREAIYRHLEHFSTDKKLNKNIVVIFCISVVSYVLLIVGVCCGLNRYFEKPQLWLDNISLCTDTSSDRFMENAMAHDLSYQLFILTSYLGLVFAKFYGGPIPTDLFLTMVW